VSASGLPRSNSKLSRNSVAPKGNRKGIVAVEVAVVFPLFLLLVVGTIDVGRAIMVQQTLVEAARAGCRVYCIAQELSNADSLAVIAQAMNQADLDGYTVDFDPNSSASMKHKAPVTVSVSIPYSQVSWLASWFFSGSTLTGSCIMPGDTGVVSPPPAG
jgi:Flp pilus assembly protein TadG